MQKHDQLNPNSPDVIESSGLTKFEVLGLKTAFNFADGHAYHDMPKLLQPVMNNIKVIWKESISKQVPELEERFKRAASRIIRSPILGNHEHLSFCPTASNSIDIAGAWLAAKKYSVGLLEPSFDNLYLLLRRRQVNVSEIQEGDLINLDNLSKKIDVFKLKSIFIINPNNPSGFELDADEFRTLCEFCTNKGIVMIIDKTFRLYSRNIYDDYQILTNSGTDYIIIEDTGKTWPTHDTKVSLMAYSKSLAKDLKCLYEEVYLCHSKFSLNLLSHLIEKTHQVGVKKIIWDEVDKRKVKINEILKDTELFSIRNKNSCPLPLEWIDCSKTNKTDLQITEALKKYDVSVLPGRYFYWNSQANNTQNIRVSLLRSDAIFDKGLDSFKHAIKNL